MYRKFDHAIAAEPCLSCAAKAHGICGALEGNDLIAFAELGRHRRLARGQTLIWEGDAPAAVANVVTGVLKLTSTGASGDEQIVGLVWPADFVGSPFGSLVNVSVTALTESEVCLFGRGDFEAFLDTRHGLARALLRRGPGFESSPPPASAAGAPAAPTPGRAHGRASAPGRSRR